MIEEQKQSPVPPGSSRCCLFLVSCLIGAAMLTALIVDTVVLMSWVKDKNKERIAIRVSASPSTIVPTNTSTQQTRFEYFRNLLVSHEISREAALSDHGSHQYTALNWLASVDPALLPESTDSNIIIERYVLALLYYATNGDAWSQKLNFLSATSICTWLDAINRVGVTRCGSDNRVRAIALGANNLVGSIPSEIQGLSNLEVLYIWGNKLDGTLPSEFGTLQQMIRLDISENMFTGPFPPQMWTMTNLRLLHFFDNRFTGTLSTQIGQLQQLTDLQVAKTHISGPVPSEIGRLSNLQVGLLHSNQFSSSIPTEIGLLVQLVNFTLYDNLLTGPIPSQVGAMSSIEYLMLWGMALSGTLPNEMGSLQNMKFLTVADNHLTGTVPTTIGALPNLQSLDISSNQFTGDVSTYFCYRTPPLQYLAADCAEVNCSCCKCS